MAQQRNTRDRMRKRPSKTQMAGSASRAKESLYQSPEGSYYAPADSLVHRGSQDDAGSPTGVGTTVDLGSTVESESTINPESAAGSGSIDNPLFFAFTKIDSYGLTLDHVGNEIFGGYEDISTSQTFPCFDTYRASGPVTTESGLGSMTPHSSPEHSSMAAPKLQAQPESCAGRVGFCSDIGEQRDLHFTIEQAGLAERICSRTAGKSLTFGSPEFKQELYELRWQTSHGDNQMMNQASVGKNVKQRRQTYDFIRKFRYHDEAIHNGGRCHTYAAYKKLKGGTSALPAPKDVSATEADLAAAFSIASKIGASSFIVSGGLPPEDPDDLEGDSTQRPRTGKRRRRDRTKRTSTKPAETLNTRRSDEREFHLLSLAIL